MNNTDKHAREKITLDSLSEKHSFDDFYPLYCSVVKVPKQNNIKDELWLALHFILTSPFVKLYCQVDEFYSLCYLCLAFALTKLVPSLVGKKTRYLRDKLYSKYLNTYGRKLLEQKPLLKQKKICFCKSINYCLWFNPPPQSRLIPALAFPPIASQYLIPPLREAPDLVSHLLPPLPSPLSHAQPLMPLQSVLPPVVPPQGLSNEANGLHGSPRIQTEIIAIDELLELPNRTGSKRNSPGFDDLEYPDPKKFKAHDAEDSPEDTLENVVRSISRVDGHQDPPLYEVDVSLDEWITQFCLDI